MSAACIDNWSPESWLSTLSLILQRSVSCTAAVAHRHTLSKNSCNQDPLSVHTMVIRHSDGPLLQLWEVHHHGGHLRSRANHAVIPKVNRPS